MSISHETADELNSIYLDNRQAGEGVARGLITTHGIDHAAYTLSLLITNDETKQAQIEGVIRAAYAAGRLREVSVR